MSADREDQAPAAQYRITVEGRFSAVHQLRLPNGGLESLHGHDWIVRATFSAPQLDSLGMVVDFHIAENSIRLMLAPLNHSNLNEHSAFRDCNPTAEVVAEYVFGALLREGLPVHEVAVTEAPGCTASFGPNVN